MALTEQGPLVLTSPDGGKAKLAELGITAAPDPLHNDLASGADSLVSPFRVH